MTIEEDICLDLTNRFPDGIENILVERNKRVNAKIKKEFFISVCRFLKEKMDFDHLSCISGVDYDKQFQIVYNLWSNSKKCILTLIVDLPKDMPKIESVTMLWKSANWHEREAFDLLGIIFENHPNLERILLPKDWTYHPLRKEYEL